MSRRFQINLVLGIALALLFLPAATYAWGNNANRLIVNRAVDTLPADLRAFFDANRSILLQHVNDPFVGAEKLPLSAKINFCIWKIRPLPF